MEKHYFTLAEASARLGADAIALGEQGVLPMAYRLPENSDTENTAYVIESGIKPGWVEQVFLYITPEQFRKVVNADRKQDRAILRHTFKSLDDLANAPEIIEQRKAVDPVTRKLIESGVKMTHLFAALDDMYVTAEAMAAYEAAAASMQERRSEEVKTEISYQFPMYARLKPHTQQFKGGRIDDTDKLPLDEAAVFASKHAGTEITPADFLRAAARGEITLRAIVHREAKLQKHDGGIYCNQGEQTENTVPKGCIPNLPLSACQQLATAGRASWRTFDGFEQIDGELMRFTIATLLDSEPDFETVLSDCRVIGFDVHALADEYIDAPVATSGTTEKAAPPETPTERKQRIVNHVNSTAAQGRTKESAYLELAAIEKCGVDNIKRIYHDKDAKAKKKAGW